VIELKGKYNTAQVFTDNVESEAISQIIELCNQEFVSNSKIRIMPDTHAGAGCTIGTTMTIQDKIVPNLVGVDIGCGMYVVRLEESNINFERLDSTIRNLVPSGHAVRDKAHKYASLVKIDDLKARKIVKYDRAMLSVGTLGGGNHFIEANKDDQGHLYIVIHSGSRYLGKQIAEYYQDVAYRELVESQKSGRELIERLKAEGRQKDIQAELNKLPVPKVSKDLAYLQGASFNDYLNDMRIVQMYAVLNRQAMMDEIVRAMGFHVVDSFTTIHNYIDLDSMILRKGAISAQTQERVIIPINMRDGSLICLGKGNPNWNFSAPHGAGRLMSRSKAKATLSMDDYTASMNGIYTSSVSQSTLDECPMAYKPIDEILSNITDTVHVANVIKPVYNFKAGE
jgi:RNA-splicing ligase RtcB